MMLRKTKTHIYTWLLALYYMLAPLEDFLSGSAGSLARYLALVIVFTALVERRGKISVHLTRVERCILWLMAVCVLSILWANDIDTALSRNVAYLLLPSITIFVGMLSFEENEYDMIINAAILGGVVTLGFLLLSGRFDFRMSARLTLTENNDPNNFAALLLLPFALCFRTKEKTNWFLVVLKLLLASAIFVVILYTGSRGCVLAVAALLLSYLLMKRAYRKIVYIVAAILVILLFWKLVLPRLPTNVIQRFSDIDKIRYDMEQNDRQRGAIWRHVIQNLLPVLPVWGVGAGCAPLAMTDFYVSQKGIHNTYLNMIVEYGVLGIPAFLWLLFSLLRNELKKRRYLETALLLGICVVIFFLDSYSKKFFWNVIMFIMIGRSVERRDAERMTKA